MYLVTKKSQEESRDGTIERVDVVVYGIFTSVSHAVAISDKYNGTVTDLTVDREGRVVVERWENPGYVTDP